MLYHLLSAGSLSSTTARDLSSLVQELQAAHAEEEQAIRADRVQVAFEASPLHALTSAGWEVADTAAAGWFWEAGAKVARKLGLRDGQPHLLVNGRVSAFLSRTERD
jgi:UDP-glucose:glycoprotein glucosyltransferase